VTSEDTAGTGADEADDQASAVDENDKPEGAGR